MKQEQFGNILNAKSGIIVHGCNAQGVMGSGLAKAIRSKYSKAYSEYRKVYLESGLQLGQVIMVDINDRLKIANAITQKNYGRSGDRYVDYDAIKQAFDTIGLYAHTHNLQVHYPMIGAGLGGGDWTIISSIIETSFADYPAVSRCHWIN